MMKVLIFLLFFVFSCGTFYVVRGQSSKKMDLIDGQCISKALKKIPEIHFLKETIDSDFPRGELKAINSFYYKIKGTTKERLAYVHMKTHHNGKMHTVHESLRQGSVLAHDEQIVKKVIPLVDIKLQKNCNLIFEE